MTDSRFQFCAERILREEGQVDGNGFLLDSKVDIEGLATAGLGLRLVLSSKVGRYRLPRCRRGELRFNTGEVIIRSELYEDESREDETREVIAHEVAHFLLHKGEFSQDVLPFTEQRIVRRETREVAAYSATHRTAMEEEAWILGSLILGPPRHVRKILLSQMLIHQERLNFLGPSTRQAEFERLQKEYLHGAWSTVSAELQMPKSSAIVLLRHLGLDSPAGGGIGARTSSP